MNLCESVFRYVIAMAVDKEEEKKNMKGTKTHGSVLHTCGSISTGN